MSVRVMSDVFQHSRSRGTDRLVLLAIADSANDHGCEAWPSMTTLASKAGVDRRTVARSIKRLCELGELQRVRKGGLYARGGVSNSYQVTVTCPQTQGHSAPSDGAPLGAESPNLGAESPGSRGTVSPNPSLSIHNHPRSESESVDKSVGRALAAEAKSRVRGLRPVPTTDNDAGGMGAGQADTEAQAVTL